MSNLPDVGTEHFEINRRSALCRIGQAALAASAGLTLARPAQAAARNQKWESAIDRGLSWLANNQSPRGRWTAGTYPTAMTALAGTAMLASGSTTTQGPYAKNVRTAVDYLMTKVRSNGLIGDPQTDTPTVTVSRCCSFPRCWERKKTRSVGRN
jgi:hypothetical protein